MENRRADTSAMGTRPEVSKNETKISKRPREPLKSIEDETDTKRRSVKKNVNYADAESDSEESEVDSDEFVLEYI